MTITIQDIHNAEKDLEKMEELVEKKEEEISKMRQDYRKDNRKSLNKFYEERKDKIYKVPHSFGSTYVRLVEWDDEQKHPVYLYLDQDFGNLTFGYGKLSLKDESREFEGIDAGEVVDESEVRELVMERLDAWINRKAN